MLQWFCSVVKVFDHARCFHDYLSRVKVMLIRHMMAGMQHSNTQHITNTHPVPCMTPCRHIFACVDFGVVQILLTIVVFVCFTWFVFSWFTGSHGFYLLDSHGFPLVSTGFHWFPPVPTAFHRFLILGKYVFVLVFQLHWVCVCVCGG